MKGFGIEVKNNLLEPKHVKAMGSAVWEYMWCLDKMTKIDDDGLGYVLGGKPIKLDELCTDLGKHRTNVSANLTKLMNTGYINLTRTGYGNIITVNKAKKRFTDKGKSDIPKTVHLMSENGKSNKTYTVDNTDINTNVLIQKVYGNPEINQLKDYFLEVLKLPKEDVPVKQSRRYWSLLLKESKTGLDGVKWLVDLAAQDEFFRNNITSSKDLYYKRVKLIARRRGGAPQIAVVS